MTEEWKEVRLGDVCLKIGSGATPRGGKETYSKKGKIALIRSQNIYNEGFKESGLVYINEVQADQLRNVNVEISDILLNITGDSVARVCLVPKEFLPARVNQHVAIIRTDQNILDSKFLSYYLSTSIMQNHLLALSSSGATRAALTKAMIESLLIKCPPLPEQKAIADILSSLDEKIELNRKMNETLEKIAQTLYKSWFVDFDPVNAKMKGEKPEGMSDEIAALFPSKLVESELGLIPEGWEVKSIKDEFNILMGVSPPGETYNDIGDGLPFHQGTKDYNFRYPNNRIYCSLPIRIATRGMTILSVRAPVGEINMVRNDICIGRGLAAIQHKDQYRSYTYYIIQFLSSRDLKKYEAYGTVFGAINKQELENIKILQPQCKTIIKNFEWICHSLDQQIEILTKNGELLQQIRDSILPRLMKKINS